MLQALPLTVYREDGWTNKAGEALSLLVASGTQTIDLPYYESDKEEWGLEEINEISCFLKKDE